MVITVSTTLVPAQLGVGELVCGAVFMLDSLIKMAEIYSKASVSHRLLFGVGVHR